MKASFNIDIKLISNNSSSNRFLKVRKFACQFLIMSTRISRKMKKHRHDRRYNSSEDHEQDEEIPRERTNEKKLERKKHRSKSQPSKSKSYSTPTPKSSNKENLNEDSGDDHKDSNISDKEESTRNRDRAYEIKNSTNENNDTETEEPFIDLDSTRTEYDLSSENEEYVSGNDSSNEETCETSRDDVRRERKRKEQEMLINSIVKTAVSTALEKVSVHLNASVSSQSASASRSDNRNVSLPKWDKKEKLRNRKQWKLWNRKVELDLKGHHLYECIQYKNGKEDWDEETRTSKMALAQSYLDDAVCKSIEVSQINSPSPFDTYSELVKQYGPNEIFDDIELWKKIKNIKFKMGYSQQRYVNDVKSICTEAALANMPFSDSMKRTIFLGEMEGIEETGHPLQVFYGNMATQPKENKTFEYVCSQFLNYTLPQVAKGNFNENNGSNKNIVSDSCSKLINEVFNETIEDVITSFDEEYDPDSIEWESDEEFITNKSSFNANETNETKEKTLRVLLTITDAKNSMGESSSTGTRKFEKKGNGDRQGNSFRQGNNLKRAGNESGNSNTSNKRFRSKDRSNTSSSANESKIQNSDKKIVHPRSDKPDGSYFIDGILVIPGHRPDYGKEGNERIRNMTEEERRANKCRKCGQYLHNEHNCPNPGPQCYRCSNFGHVTPKCPFANKSKLILRNDFNVEILFAIDSAANGHVTNERDTLIDYQEFKVPKTIKFNINEKTFKTSAVGVGRLPILMQYKKGETILVVNKVYYCPTAEDKIISANAFNAQFKTSITLNTKSGSIFGRKINTKLCVLEVLGGVYYIRGKTLSSNVKGKDNLMCNNDNLNIKFNDKLSVQHLPLRINFNEINDDNDLSDISDNESDNENSVKDKKNKRKKLSAAQIEKRLKETDLWHRRFSHISAPCVYKNSKVTIGMRKVFSENRKNCCEVCALAKFVRKKFDETRERATRVGQILHVDLIGPITPETFQTKKKYVLIVLDDYSRYLQTYVMKSKSETYLMMEEAMRNIQSKFPGPGQFAKVRCDKGGEFEAQEFLDVIKKYGAEPEFAETNVHEHNGAAERLIRTLEDRLRALLFESGFPDMMWGQLIETATYIYNRSVHSSIGFLTPFEKYHGKPPKVAHLRIIGSRVYVYKNKVSRGKKCEPRSNIQYLVGYTSTGYLTFDPETLKTNEECIVRIDESKGYKDDFPRNSKYSDFHFPERETVTNNDLNPVETNVETSHPTIEKGGGVIGPTPSLKGGGAKNNTKRTRAKKKKKDPIRLIMKTRSKVVTRGKRIDYNDLIRTNLTTIILNDNSNVCNVNVAKINDEVNDKVNFDNFGGYDKDLYMNKVVPIKYKKAINDPQWTGPIQKEIDAWTRLNVFELVPRTKDKKAIPVKWLFVEKENGTKKARVVACGNLDPEKYLKEEKRSPTPSQLVVKWFLAYAARKGWSLQQIDIDNAFLNGEINRTKYIRIPQGFEGNNDTHVGKLNRPLYGLAIAPMCWNHTFTKFLLSNGFRRTPREECVFVKDISATIKVLMLVYVDDILLSSSSVKAIEDNIELIERKFCLKKMGFPKKFIGIQFNKITPTSFFLHQSDLIDSVLKEFPFDKNLKPVVPMKPPNDWKINENEQVHIYPYRKVIGTLLYVANTTRIDIAQAVGYLARAQINPQRVHHKAISELLAYLNVNKNNGLLYRRNMTNDSKVQLFADADHAGDKSKKSTSGHVIIYHGSTIHWRSHLQTTISESTGEAELKALTEGMRDAIFIIRLQEELLNISEFPIIGYEDNESTHTRCTTNVSANRLKHIEIQYFKVKEYSKLGQLKLLLVGSAQQLADILTKPVSPMIFKTLKNQLMYLNENNEN